MQPALRKPLPRQGIEAPQGVHQPQLQRLLTTPDKPAEQGIVIAEALAAPLAHRRDKLLMGAVQYRLPELALLRGHLGKGVEERLVVAGGIDAPLDAQLIDGLLKAEAGVDDPDGAHQARRCGDDLIGTRGDIVGTTGADILDHRDDRLIAFAAQSHDLVEDALGLHRAATGTVDMQHHRLTRFRLPGSPEPGIDALRTGGTLGLDHALYLDHPEVRSIRPTDRGRARQQTIEGHRQRGGDQRREQETEEQLPAP